MEEKVTAVETLRDKMKSITIHKSLWQDLDSKWEPWSRAEKSDQKIQSEPFDVGLGPGCK